MSMSTHIVGIRPPDDLWRKHKAIWDACAAVDICPPRETMEFFGCEAPDDAGILIHVRELGDAVTDWTVGARGGFQVEIAKLPTRITHLRFYNAY